MSCPICQGYDSYHCPNCAEAKDKDCPDCQGLGIEPYRAINLETQEIINVTHSAWIIMPEDEEEAALLSARGKKQKFCQYSEGGYTCATCRGCGKIAIDSIV